MSSLKFLNMCQLKIGVGRSYISAPNNTLSLYLLVSQCSKVYWRRLPSQAHRLQCQRRQRWVYWQARSTRSVRPKEMCGLHRFFFSWQDCTDSASLGRTAQILLLLAGLHRFCFSWQDCTDSASLGRTAQILLLLAGLHRFYFSWQDCTDSASLGRTAQILLLFAGLHRFCFSWQDCRDSASFGMTSQILLLLAQ
jgi:hypothetical protein